MGLTEREIRVLKMRFGIGGYTHTLEEIGQQFKVTRGRILQIQNKAIRKLMHPTRKHHPLIKELTKDPLPDWLYSKHSKRLHETIIWLRDREKIDIQLKT